MSTYCQADTRGSFAITSFVKDSSLGAGTVKDSSLGAGTVDCWDLQFWRQSPSVGFASVDRRQGLIIVTERWTHCPYSILNQDNKDNFETELHLCESTGKTDLLLDDASICGRAMNTTHIVEDKCKRFPQALQNILFGKGALLLWLWRQFSGLQCTWQSKVAHLHGPSLIKITYRRPAVL